MFTIHNSINYRPDQAFEFFSICHLLLKVVELLQNVEKSDKLTFSVQAQLQEKEMQLDC